jgi:hypothetical protein
VKVLLRLPQRATYVEYLGIEANSDARWRGLGRDRRIDFQSFETFEAYIVAAQDERCVKVYRRSSAGAWNDLPDVYRHGDRFELPSLTSAITVDEIYDGILDDTGRSLLR